MLMDMDLPWTYWEYALIWFDHVHNCLTPAASLLFDYTPPKTKTYPVFGSIAYVYNESYRKTDIDRTQSGIVVQILSNAHGYGILLSNGTLIRSNYVRFDDHSRSQPIVDENFNRREERNATYHIYCIHCAPTRDYTSLSDILGSGALQPPGL